MTELRDPTRQVLADIVTALVERHGGPTKVGRAVGADRSTVHRWMKGDIGIDKLGLLAERLEEPMSIRFGPGTTTKEPPPEWARAMEQRLTEVLLTNRETFVQTLAEQTARYGVERALASQPPGEPAPDKQGPQRERAARR